MFLIFYSYLEYMEVSFYLEIPSKVKFVLTRLKFLIVSIWAMPVLLDLTLED